MVSSALFKTEGDANLNLLQQVEEAGGETKLLHIKKMDGSFFCEGEDLATAKTAFEFPDGASAAVPFPRSSTAPGTADAPGTAAAAEFRTAAIGLMNHLVAQPGLARGNAGNATANAAESPASKAMRRIREYSRLKEMTTNAGMIAQYDKSIATWHQKLQAADS